MYKEIETKLENIIFEAREENGKILSYRIRPAEGYKLHEITLDENVYDEVTRQPTDKVKLGFTKSYVTAGAEYDFIKNERQIYAEEVKE